MTSGGWFPGQPSWGGWGPVVDPPPYDLPWWLRSGWRPQWPIHVDPPPDAWGWGGRSGGGRPSWPPHVDPLPWGGGRSVPSWPWRWPGGPVDPPPDQWIGGGAFGGRSPVPVDPPPWSDDLIPWGDRIRWPHRWIVDPPPDFGARIDGLRQWVRSVLLSAGHAEEQLEGATVGDFLQAVEAVTMPAAARGTASVTAAQVARMDRPALERLKHQLASERQRLDSLNTHIDAQLKKDKG